ncbi:hypothetical protein B0H34DRAFT_163708 [Crassisporium funariophilum]|nr:hypothetical protein B0H34DRAFT_163708 [Crassisporium funariophilum]
MVSTIGDTFGAMLIGALVTMTIYGITTLQAYFYYMSFPKDGIATKLLVASIWTLDTLHAIFMCHCVHFYLITGYGHPEALVDGTWSLFISIAINVTIAFIVQCFFTHRIFQLCSPQKRWWVTGVIALTVFCHFVFGIETVVFLFIKKQFSRLKEIHMAAVPFGVFAILSDIFIAVALCLLLGNNRSDFDDTNSVIDRLIIFAINRCILTSAMAILETIVFSVLPNSFYSIAIDFVIGKLYANSLLAVLNSRATLRSSNSRGEFDSTELSTRFHIASAVAPNYQTTSLVQVRTRDSNRGDRANVSDSEKESRHIITTSSSPNGKRQRPLGDDVHA